MFNQYEPSKTTVIFSFLDHQIVLNELSNVHNYVKVILDKRSGSKWSTALSVTTDAPSNVPGSIATPTLESKTSTSINTAPGAVSGMSNVRVELYSNAGLITLVSTQASGNFYGLCANTTYYAVTVGDDVNESTWATEIKRSTALSVTTDAPMYPDLY